ncbi:flagellar hook-associated protein FlgK [Franzmannia qiaohouensis]|uniref:Flagellar hook-associated protein 1 n=1 Tax=Franzmannia qiaohouensis TaxID=1329370 RepID=A0ABU1HF13_9GAMM|nr:flagellar hook-associated protein FlgK [Halomonas qiaohouensis]MDR5906061.1 flagellar hook-associated protein FlgK [Halomonas qiaohouensis]
MSIFSIGLSGLNAAQNALNTTSNNISNVYTPGYNRELTLLGEGGGAGGVKVNDIQRQFNQYVADQLNASTSSSSALKAYQGQISQIDNLLADRDAGLAPLMQNFFSAMEDLAGSPSDPAARQGVLGAADTLSAQFRSFDRYLDDMQRGVNGQIRDEVTQINNLTDQIAGLNKEIALARARTGQAPNSLLNQRDEAIADLSKRMNVRVNIQDGKTYNISLPNGQPLVSGTNQFDLEAIESANDPQRMVLGYRDGNGSVSQLNEGAVTGGTLGGLMTFRAETLDKTQNQIGQLAVSLAAGFNEQHRLGQDLNGEQGEDLFSIGQPQAYRNERNNSAVEIAEARFGDLDDLRATDYTVRVTDGGAPAFEVVRKDNGRVVDHAFDPGTNELSFGGVVIGFDGAGFENGDRFEVQPVRRAGASMETQISDLDKIAAASFVETDGDMAIGRLSAAPGALQNIDGDGFELTLDENGVLSFNDGTGVEVLRNGEVMNDGDPIVAGDTLTVDGVSFTVSELPAAGQETSLTLSAAPPGTGNNRNALAMQGLQDVSLVGGTSSVSQAYGSMVSDVGNRTNIVQVNLDAQQGLTDQLRAVQQSESGVNLDEEAANLIRYQQYYQANARVIDIGSSLLDTILGLRA